MPGITQPPWRMKSINIIDSINQSINRSNNHVDGINERSVWRARQKATTHSLLLTPQVHVTRFFLPLI